MNRRITKSYVHDPTNVGAMVSEHRELLAAAEDGDQQRLVRLVGEHLVAGYSEAIPEELADPAADISPPPLAPHQ